MDLNPTIVSVVIFFGVTGLVTALMFLVREHGQSSLEDRLDILAGKKSPNPTPALTREALIQESVSSLNNLAQSALDRFDNLKLLFLQADTSMKPEHFFLATIGMSGVGLVSSILLKLPVPLYPILMLLFAAFPLLWLLWRRSRRFKKFAKQMPDAMELIARALRSGHSLASGLHVVVEEMPEPISKEFGMAYEEQKLGIPIEQALKNVHKRMPNLDFKFFAMAVTIQRQSGGDLAEILDKIGHIVRERFRILGQVQALTGEGRISGIVLMALPIALFFAVWKLNPDYVMLLFEDEIGKQMIAVAIFLQVLGAVAIKKIITIKV